MPTERPRAALAALALFAALGPLREASAAGLYFSERGVRPLGRGGAFVAGADDLGAIYYNPAGIAEAGTQLLLDAGVMRFGSSFTRQAIVRPSDPNTGAPGRGAFIQTFDKVDGTAPPIPIPTIAGSYALRPDLVVAAGVYAPYAALPSYPETLPNGKPGPQRYSLLSLDGSALAVLGAWVGYRPFPELEIGAGPTVLLGTFQTRVDFGACVPERFLCAPEQPAYDAQGQLRVGTIAAPSGTLGATLIPLEKLRIGASFQLPYFIDSNAKLQTRLPQASVFQNASVNGDSAEVKFKLPWIARLGVELRPFSSTRVELAFVFEKWSMHDQIEATPSNVSLRNVALFPPEYKLGSISIDRHFQDAWSLRLGGEQSIEVGPRKLDLRAGLSYETSAVPRPYLSVLTIDMAKVTLGLGAGLHVTPNLRIDALLALIFPQSVDVSPGEASLYKVNPVRANVPPGSDVPINGGNYQASAQVFGLGMRYLFDASP